MDPNTNSNQTMPNNPATNVNPYVAPVSPVANTTAAVSPAPQAEPEAMDNPFFRAPKPVSNPVMSPPITTPVATPPPVSTPAPVTPTEPKLSTPPVVTPVAPVITPAPVMISAAHPDLNTKAVEPAVSELKTEAAATTVAPDQVKAEPVMTESVKTEPVKIEPVKVETVTPAAPVLNTAPAPAVPVSAGAAAAKPEATQAVNPADNKNLDFNPLRDKIPADFWGLPGQKPAEPVKDETAMPKVDAVGANVAAVADPVSPVKMTEAVPAPVAPVTPATPLPDLPPVVSPVPAAVSAPVVTEPVKEDIVSKLTDTSFSSSKLQPEPAPEKNPYAFKAEGTEVKLPQTAPKLEEAPKTEPLAFQGAGGDQTSAAFAAAPLPVVKPAETAVTPEVPAAQEAKTPEPLAAATEIKPAMNDFSMLDTVGKAGNDKGKVNVAAPAPLKNPGDNKAKRLMMIFVVIILGVLALALGVLLAQQVAQ